MKMGTYYSYNCQSCGTREYMQRSVRRCNFCGITLCRRCRRGGVCPRDYMILQPKEMAKLAQASYLAENGCGCAFGTCFLTILICLSIGMFYAFGIAIFVLVSISVGFIVGGRNEKKRIQAEILARLNEEIGTLRQNGLRDPPPAGIPLDFAPPPRFDQPLGRIPPTSFIPPTSADDLEPRANEGQFPYEHATVGTSTMTCGACGARLFPIDGKIPDFCAFCGNAVIR
ncbi:MAG: hypothetical protein JW839_17680 [Candidatus Lokiarchaeota archaeon]|nr:hypothetical protein [Candidatus Lokiarchaeota archaeon]